MKSGFRLHEGLMLILDLWGLPTVSTVRAWVVSTTIWIRMELSVMKTMAFLMKFYPFLRKSRITSRILTRRIRTTLFVGYEDYDEYGAVLPTKQRKVGKARPRKVSSKKPDDQKQPPKPVIYHNEQVQRLVECMPHLKQLQTHSSRIPSGASITRLEYGKDIELPRRKSRKTFDSGTWTGSASDSLAKQLGPKSNKPCCLRVLLVEDLSTGLMRALGSQYYVDPEAFAAHLSMSSARPPTRQNPWFPQEGYTPSTQPRGPRWRC